jgi:F5/8 type C domain
MKRCPKCKRTYDDDTLRFCLEDGSPLFDPHGSEAPATEILPASTATEILPGRATPTLKSSGPTVPSYMNSDAARAKEGEGRSSNPILTFGVIAIAVLLLALVGIAGIFVLRQSGGSKLTASEGSPSVNSQKQTSSQAPPIDSPSPSEQSSGPLKITASASSTRLAVQANTYYASNAMDGKRATAWIEGVDGWGEGEWIRFDFDREIVLHRILFQPGYFKSPQIWAENNRLATVTAYFSDGSSRDISFADRMESQKTDIGSVRTRWVKLVIKSVYYGSDPDTALSEIAFEWDQ